MNRPRLNENGEWRCETIHRMGRRLPGWDYRRPAIYVITIVVDERSRQPLGEVVVRGREPDEWLALAAALRVGLSPDDVEAKVVFSELGRAVFDHFRKISRFTPEIDPL